MDTVVHQKRKDDGKRPLHNARKQADDNGVPNNRFEPKAGKKSFIMGQPYPGGFGDRASWEEVLKGKLQAIDRDVVKNKNSNYRREEEQIKLPVPTNISAEPWPKSSTTSDMQRGFCDSSLTIWNGLRYVFHSVITSMTALVVLGLCGIFDFTLQDKNEICKYVKLNLHMRKRN